MKPTTKHQIASAILYLIILPSLFILFVIGLGAAAHLLYYLLRLGWTWY